MQTVAPEQSTNRTVRIDADRMCHMQTPEYLAEWNLAKHSGPILTPQPEYSRQDGDDVAIHLIADSFRRKFADLPALWRELGGWWQGEMTVVEQSETDLGLIYVRWHHDGISREFTLLDDRGLVVWAEVYTDRDPVVTNIRGLDEYDALSRLINTLHDEYGIVEETVSYTLEFQGFTASQKEYEELKEWLDLERAAHFGRIDGAIRIEIAGNIRSIDSPRYRMQWTGDVNPLINPLIEIVDEDAEGPGRDALIAAARQHIRQSKVDAITRPGPMPAEFPRGKWLASLTPSIATT